MHAEQIKWVDDVGRVELTDEQRKRLADVVDRKIHRGFAKAANKYGGPERTYRCLHIRQAKEGD